MTTVARPVPFSTCPVESRAVAVTVSVSAVRSGPRTSAMKAHL